jgi:hypothetical protein
MKRSICYICGLPKNRFVCFTYKCEFLVYYDCNNPQHTNERYHIDNTSSRCANDVLYSHGYAILKLFY